MLRFIKSLTLPAGFLLVFLGITLNPFSVRAANVCVDDSSDGAPNSLDCDATCSDGSANCSLRDAIEAVNSGDHIIFAAALTGQTINLGSALATPTDFSIDGPGSANLTISGQDTVPILTNNFIVNISGLSMAHGRSTSDGGCILNGGTLTLDDVDIGHCEINANVFHSGIGIFNDDSAQLTISNSTIHDNQVTSGATGNITAGAIENLGTLQMDHSTIRNNTAVGVGGIESFSAVTLSDVTVADNTATGGPGFLGGGIFLTALGAVGNFTNVTISGNKITGADGVGGGLAVTEEASVTLTNVTISGNSVTGSGSAGGGLEVETAAQATLTNVTIAENSAATGGALRLDFDPIVTLENVILANSTSGSDCAVDNGAGLSDGGGNLVEDGSCGFAVGGDPNLGPLQNNGGSTLTQALLFPSPAIDAGVSAGCPATDQRGVARPKGSGCDIGAVEFNAGIIDFSSATYSADESAGTATILVIYSGGDGVVSADFATSDGSATAGLDYTAVTQSVSFNSLTPTQTTINIPIANDNVSDPNETVNLTLSNPTGGASLGPNNPAVLTITEGSGSGVSVNGGGCELGGGTGSLQTLWSPLLPLAGIWWAHRRRYFSSLF